MSSPFYLIEDRGYKTPCCVWQGALSTKGYGLITNPNYNGSGSKSINAHIFYWEKENGPVPDGMVLHHLCNVRACCNAEHLEICTNTDNVRRGKVCKLTMDDADVIRKEYLTTNITQVALAKRYGVHKCTINAIVKGRQWL